MVLLNGGLTMTGWRGSRPRIISRSLVDRTLEYALKHQSTNTPHHECPNQNPRALPLPIRLASKMAYHRNACRPGLFLDPCRLFRFLSFPPTVPLRGPCLNGCQASADWPSSPVSSLLQNFLALLQDCPALQAIESRGAFTKGPAFEVRKPVRLI